MKIGELAKRSSIAPSRIRFYESIGLLQVERRANGYRTYPAETAVVLELIAAAQQAGFSLEEIRSLLPGNLGQWQHDALLTALTAKVADIEKLQARLAQTKAHLLALISDIEARPEEIDCAANAERVLSRVRGRAGGRDQPA